MVCRYDLLLLSLPSNSLVNCKGVYFELSKSCMYIFVYCIHTFRLKLKVPLVGIFTESPYLQGLVTPLKYCHYPSVSPGSVAGVHTPSCYIFQCAYRTGERLFPAATLQKKKIVVSAFQLTSSLRWAFNPGPQNRLTGCSPQGD